MLLSEKEVVDFDHFYNFRSAEGEYKGVTVKTVNVCSSSDDKNSFYAFLKYLHFLSSKFSMRIVNNELFRLRDLICHSNFKSSKVFTLTEQPRLEHK